LLLQALNVHTTIYSKKQIINRNYALTNYTKTENFILKTKN
jgi:hypothetical protein